MEPTEMISKTPCPMCLGLNVVSFLRNRPGRFETYCDKGHKWNDTEQLQSAVAVAKANYAQAFEALAPPKPVPGPPATVVVIGPEDKKELERVLGGQVLTGPSDLRGAIFAMQEELKTLRMEAATYRAMKKTSANAPPGQPNLAAGVFALAIPEWSYEIVTENAVHEGKSEQEWLQEQLGAYLEAYFSFARR